MRISREKAKSRVERAISETRPESASVAWDSAWRAIYALQARNLGDDTKIAEELAMRMRDAARCR